MYPLPPFPVKKKPKAPRRNSDAVKILDAMDNAAQRQKHPSIDPRYLASSSHNDSTTAGLQKCTTTYLHLLGHQVERTGCTGRVIDQRKIFVDVVGRTRQIGSMKWIPTSGTRGSADISSILPGGLSVKIEIKMSDTQSLAQKAYQASIEKAGGIYIICHSFEEFFNWYNDYTR